MTRASVTGRYAGPVSRLLAAALDLGFVLASYSLGVGLVGFLARALLNADVTRVAGLPATVLLLAWGGFYLMVATLVSARTVGKGVLGLKVVDRHGGYVHVRQAVLRVLFLPVSFFLFGVGLALVVLRRDHRGLHDLVARTAVVYDWGDRPAELPAPLSAFLSGRR